MMLPQQLEGGLLRGGGGEEGEEAAGQLVADWIDRVGWCCCCWEAVGVHAWPMLCQWLPSSGACPEAAQRPCPPPALTHPPAPTPQVALDAAAAYQAQLAALPGLSPQGAAQLAADLEYFANVLGTLGVVVPPSLAAWQAATGAPPEGLPAVAEAAAQGGDPGAQQAVQLVARLRGLQLAGGAPAQV